MYFNENRVSKIDLILSLSKSLDLIIPALVGHHMRVAYIALQIALKLDLDKKNIRNLVIAALLHDAGALSLEERMDALKFDMINPNHHARAGYFLLNEYKSFNRAAKIIKYHHAKWNEREKDYEKIPFESYILNLSDRVDVLINKEIDFIKQKERVIPKIVKQRGRMFNPIVVDAFLEVSNESFNLIDMDKNYIRFIFGSYLEDIFFNIDELIEVTKIFENIIDFRSRFTSTHSSDVAATAVKISGLMGFSDIEMKEMKVAGQLHDIGKLGVPGYIIEKPGRLDNEEIAIIRNHGLYTYTVLNEVNGLDNITHWAAFHHEKLNGKGYPFNLTNDSLDIGSRIMAVADIFTAITEDRPYRRGMDKIEVQRILDHMVKNNEIDGEVVSLLKSYYDDIDCIRKEEQGKAALEFEAFCKKATSHHL